jgi:hypothetical protein
VRGVRLAGVPLRPDCPQPELPHQPPDAPTADRNPLPRERHLQSPAAVDRMVGENPIEPLQKIEFLCGLRPGPIIEAAARNPEQRALPAYGPDTSLAGCLYLSSQTSSMRQPLKMLLTMIVNPLTEGCQQLARRS